VVNRWVAGALTRAVLDGRWALMEDIDRAPFEVLSALLPLLERRRLFLPGRGQLLGTSQLSSLTPSSFLLLHSLLALFAAVLCCDVTWCGVSRGGARFPAVRHTHDRAKQPAAAPGNRANSQFAVLSSADSAAVRR
jgi:hypothetical protein